MASHTEGGPVDAAYVAAFREWFQPVPAAPDATSAAEQVGTSAASEPKGVAPQEDGS